VKTHIIWNILAIISFILAGVMVYEGVDKIINYYNSENYPILNENVYVGGDAYNFIINSNYATGYYVLALIEVVSGFGFLILGYLSKINEIHKNSNEKISTTQDNLMNEGVKDYSKQFDDLPPL